MDVGFGHTRALNTPETDKLNTEWNKAVRRTLGLPRTTQIKLLSLLTGHNNVHWQYAFRWLRMSQSMLSSINLHVKYLAHRSLHHVIGNMGKNVVRVKMKSKVRNIFDDSLMHMLLLMMIKSKLTK